MSLNLKLESYCFGTGLSLSCLICKIGIIIVPPSSGYYKMVKKKKKEMWKRWLRVHLNSCSHFCNLELTVGSAFLPYLRSVRSHSHSLPQFTGKGLGDGRDGRSLGFKKQESCLSIRNSHSVLLLSKK